MQGKLLASEDLIFFSFPLQDGETPLLRATQKKHTGIVSLLLEKGASVAVADKVSDFSI